MAHRPYKRLPGRSSGFFNIATLWEADDHLLLVESSRISETYRRFFYRDIQAIVICETKTGLIVNAVLIVIGFIFGGAALAGTPETAAIFGTLSGLFFLGVLINTLRGPTCRCTLRTAVQTQKLPSLNRVPRARKILSRLQPQIAAAQPAPPSP